MGAFSLPSMFEMWVGADYHQLAMIDLTPTVGRNLALLRKNRGLTQGQLAEHFAYSDKAISKWERGEALPDLNMLYELADFYGVTLDFLTHPQSEATLREIGRNDPRKVASNRLIITLMAVLTVWTFATILFVTDILMKTAWEGWMAFVWAVPFSFCVIIPFNHFWGHKEWMFPFLTTFIITFLLAAYIELGLDLPENEGWELGYIFFLGIPLTLIGYGIHRYRALRDDMRKSSSEEESGKEEPDEGE